MEPANLGSRGEYDNYWTTGVDPSYAYRKKYHCGVPVRPGISPLNISEKVDNFAVVECIYERGQLK